MRSMVHPRPGRGAPDPTPWVPLAGHSAVIGYEQNAHPGGLMATAEELAPKYQTWGMAGSNAPWDGSPTSYVWQTRESFGGGAWDATARRFIEYGGGHQCVCVPAPSAFSIVTRAHSWLATPLPTDGLGLASDPPSQANTAAAYGDKWDAAESCYLGDSSGWGAAAQSGVIQPEVQHAQYGLVWIPGSAAGNANGIILNCTSPTGKYGGAVDLRQRTYFDLDDAQWKLCTNFQRSDAGYYAGAACWFGGSVNRAFALMSSSSTQKTAIQNFDPAAKTWAETNATAAVDVVYGCGGMVAHLASGLLLAFIPSTSGGNTAITGAGSGAVQFRIRAVSAAAVVAGSHTWQYLDYSNAGGTWPLSKIAIGGGSFRENFEALGAVYCPRNGCVYIYDWRYNSTTLWKITPPADAVTTADYLAGTWAVTTETFTGAIANLAYTGNTGEASWYPYNRLAWDEVSGCLIGIPPYYLQPPFAIRPTGV